ncbi:MAG: tRNA lysidine(34) synthetase TilS [Coriobacteriales bacterium]|nr:tRNA lysidine(34) synthetase TilS [Coriobacteriales bacterium]
MKKTEPYTVLDKMRATIEAHNLLSLAHKAHKVSAPLVLMVSGGSDSVALLRLFVQLFPTSLDSLTVLHVNHQLRKEQSDKDEEFVRSLACALGLRLEVRRINVAELQDSSGHPNNAEQVGRQERHRFANELLDELCDEAGCERSEGRIVTAHTLDDRAETFFMRSLVGAGPAGLRSISFQNGRVIRPLLDCTRAELRAWLASEPQQDPLWCEDETNADTTYLRSFVRHEVLARLTERNPQVLSALQRSMDILASEDDLLAAQAHELETRFVRSEGEVILVSGELFGEPLPLVRRVIRTACNRSMPSYERITFEHIEEIVQKGPEQGFGLTLPGNVKVSNEYGTLRFSRQPKECPAKDFPAYQELDLRILQLADLKEFKNDPVAYAKNHATPTTIFFDAETLPSFPNGSGAPNPATPPNPLLFLTTPQNADKFCPLGLAGKHRLVSDVLIDRKIPARLRKNYPLACVEVPAAATAATTAAAPKSTSTNPSPQKNKEIVWIVGIQQDDRYKVTPKTTTIVRVSYSGTLPSVGAQTKGT